MQSFQRWILQYARFLFLPILQMVTLVSFFAGGNWLWAGFVAYLVLAIGVDEIGGKTDTTSEESISGFRNFLLYLVVAFMAIELGMLAWFVGAGDFLNIGTALSGWAGLDLFAAREASGLLALVGAVFSVGFNLGGAAGSVGHELMHRVNNRFDFFMGHWALAMCSYSSFMFEHIYGHHRNAGLADDCGTAWRGMSFWHHLFRSIKFSHIHAFGYEKEWLGRSGKGWFRYQNRVLRGYFMAASIVVVFYSAAGWWGLVAYMGVVVMAIGLIEVFNYIGHYGLVRVPGQPILPRHSWNSYNGVLTGLLFNLPRHSSHHVSVNRRYWQLKRETDAPVMPMGASTMAAIALIPPLFYRVIRHHLADWDKHFATPQERALFGTQSIPGRPR